MEYLSEYVDAHLALENSDVDPAHESLLWDRRERARIALGAALLEYVQKQGAELSPRKVIMLRDTWWLE